MVRWVGGAGKYGGGWGGSKRWTPTGRTDKVVSERVERWESVGERRLEVAGNTGGGAAIGGG